MVEALRTHMAWVARLTPERQRAETACIAARSAEQAQCKTRREDIGSLRCTWFQSEAASRSVLMYAHGGGYVFGSTRTHAAFLARLAVATERSVLAFDYRLAPRHPCPAAIDDALAVYEALVVAGHRDIIVGGDSAGGGIALAMTVEARRRSWPLPCALVLVSPWVDLTLRHPSIDANVRTDWGTRDELEIWARAYAGALARDDPRVSPLYADLRGLPPTLLVAGGGELLRDEISNLADRASRVGVDTELATWADMAHAFPTFGESLRAANEAIAKIAQFARAHGGS